MQSIQAKINETLKRENDERANRQRSGKWNPSSFGSCYRKQYFNRSNTEQSNPSDERTLRVFKVGRIFEEFITSYSEVKDLQVKAETETVFGYADGVAEDRVYEFKSQHSRAFWHSAKKTFNFLKDKHHHVLQGAYYAIVLKKPQVHFVYVSKDDLCVDEVVIPLTDEVRNDVFKEIETLNNFWNKEELPPPQPRLFGNEKDGTPKECNRYCNYRDHCYGLQKGDEKK